MWLIATDIVRPGRTFLSLKRAPTSALGGLLAFLLLVATTFSVSHALHQLLHQDGAGNSHFCLACSFAKGQVGAATVAPLPVMSVLEWVSGIPAAASVLLPVTDYRLSPSRAPPLRSSLATVAG
jgi:hypothetical protein